MKSFPGSPLAILASALALVSCAGSDSGSTASGGGNTSQGNGGNGNVTSGGDTGVGGNGAGGVQSNGGTTNSGGINATGGFVNTGGSMNTGGAVNAGGTQGTGGSAATGGSKAAGGSAATGGSKATGGTSPSGGAKAGGGTSNATGGVSTGGTKASGGTIATGGSLATGGSKTTGGTTSTGGTAVTGGTKATGGMPATGGRATGGASSSAGACTYTGSGNLTASGDGELTCYYFGQGTAKGECMGSNTYKTNCGYCGTEGSATGNACNSGHNDAVANISTGSYYVAVPNWGQGASCGLCVSVSYGGKTITATVVDNCAGCGAGHIDLSPAAGAALGMGTGAGQTEDATGVSWKTVACPVGTSSIVAVYNGTYAGQIYFQNVAFPIASASAVVGGTTHTANLTNGMWDFGITLTPGTQITLKNIAGHTVTGTFGSNGGSLGVQFPTTC